MSKRKYDVAAYIWPAYCQDERTDIFWPEGNGEWQSVKSAKPKFEGHQWPRKPLWGYVNEADPKVMEMEIGEAVSHGVNVFIYDWYWYDKRPFLEGCLNNGFLKARNNDQMKFYLMWANHHACSLWDKRISDFSDNVVWQGFQTRDEFEKIADRIIEKYFSHPSYYTIDGKPVFCIYEINVLVEGLGGVEQTKQALNWFRERAKECGYKGVHLQAILQKSMEINEMGIIGNDGGITSEYVAELGFDSVTHYQFCHITDIDRKYCDIIDDVKQEWKKISEKNICPYFPHVSIGWDNNPRFNKFRQGVTKEATPELFAECLEDAKKYLDQHPEQPPLITVNSWNEWTESSYLQPDDLNGYAYLDAIKRVFLGTE